MKIKKVHEFAQVLTGGTPSTEISEYWDNGTIPWLQSGCCQNCYVNKASKYITQKGYDNSVTKLMPKDTVLIALTGATAGKVGYLTFEACGNQSITGILPNDVVIPKFLFYFLQFKRNKILADCVGGAQPHISQAYVKNIEVPVYSVTEQEIIVKQLELISDLIIKNKENVNALDELIKSKFIEMFENKGFELVPIRELVDTKKISAKKNFNSEEEIKYIDISSIDNERNIIIGYTNYIMKDAPSRAQQCLRKNDILISTVRPNLRNIAIFKEEDLDYVGSSGFCILRAKKVNPDYLKYVVLNDKFTNAMVDLTTGASYPAIRDEDVLNYLMINAPLELQNTFADFVQQIDKSKFLIKRQIELLEELLTKKMDEYFK